jgi:hypothetical protein
VLGESYWLTCAARDARLVLGLVKPTQFLSFPNEPAAGAGTARQEILYSIEHQTTSQDAAVRYVATYIRTF